MKNRKGLFRLVSFLAVLVLVNTGAASNAMARVKYKDFTLPSTTGEKVSLSQFQGKSPVLLVFFATWCPPCNREVPHLIELQNKYSLRGLKILAVDIDEPLDLVNEFIKEKGVNYTVLLDETGRVAETYNVTGIPTNILFNKKGEVKFAGHNIPKNVEDVL